MKRILLLVVFIGFVVGLNAQKHSLGISGGINRTNITSEFEEKWESNTGFTGDICYSYRFANGVLAEAGIRFHQTGFNNDLHFVFSETEIADVNFKYQYEYIGFPLKFGYVNAIDHFSWFAKVGVFPAFLTKGQLTTSLVHGALNDPAIPLGITNFKSHANTFDLAGLAEFGVSYQNGRRFFLSRTNIA